MSTPVIELTDVKKGFGPVEVLKGVNLQVHAGKVTALVGDNGAGKSTTFKSLIFLISIIKTRLKSPINHHAENAKGDKKKKAVAKK